MDRREFGKRMAGAISAVTYPAERAWRWPATFDAPSVDGARLNAQLAALAQFGKNPQGGVSRVAYSDADKQGREYVLGLMRAAALDPKIDAAGNLIARRAGSDASLKSLVFGSHIDSVPEGGNYDGDVGSLAAIEVARTLAGAKIVTRH